MIIKNKLIFFKFFFLIIIFIEPFMGILDFQKILDFKYFNKIQISDLFVLILFIIIIWNYKSIHIFEIIKKNFNKFSFYFLFLLTILFLNIFNSNEYGFFKFSLLFLYLFNTYLIIHLWNINELNKIILIFFTILFSLVFFVYFSEFLGIVNTNFFTKQYSNFPLFDNFFRLIGPHKPTSKLFATYLFFAIIIIEINKEKIHRYLIYFLKLLILIMSLLTFSRPGFCAIAFIFITYFLRRDEKIISIVTFILFFLSMIIISLIHPELNKILIECKNIKLNEINDQYFGWFKYPNFCSIDFNLDIYKNTYFILKQSYFYSIDLKSFLIGNGANSFSDFFISLAKENIISNHYVNNAFPLVQSTFLTLLFEYGIVTTILYVIFLYYNFFKYKNNIYILWIFLFFIICIDLDVQHFRFIYIFIPIIYMTLKSKLSHEN